MLVLVEEAIQPIVSADDHLLERSWIGDRIREQAQWPGVRDEHPEGLTLGQLWEWQPDLVLIAARDQGRRPRSATRSRTSKASRTSRRRIRRPGVPRSGHAWTPSRRRRRSSDSPSAWRDRISRGRSICVLVHRGRSLAHRRARAAPPRGAGVAWPCAAPNPTRRRADAHAPRPARVANHRKHAGNVRCTRACDRGSAHSEREASGSDRGSPS